MPSRSIHPTDFTLLQHLQVLLEQRGVSRAAERLGISQPAMSRILARLRDQFSDPLLVRGRSGMTLTPRAEALLAPLQLWLREGENLLREPGFAPGTARRVFRAASTDFGTLAVVAPAVARLEAEAPGCSLSVEPLSDVSLRRLADGELDLVITGYRPHGVGVRSRRLFQDGYLGLARADHPAVAAPPSKAELTQWPHVVTNIGEGLGDWIMYQLPELTLGRGVIRASGFSVAPYLVAAGGAVAILPARAARRFAETHGLATFALPLTFDPLDYFLVWHERSQADAATQWLVEVLASCCPAPD